MIPNDKWKWFGHAGHFICGQWCRYHLVTQIGPWLISTVGEYVPDEGSREILAECRGIVLEGKGDARLADYMKKIGFEDIGMDRKYETMVFKAGPACVSETCGCGLPSICGSELDFRGYNVAGDAAKGHMALCLKWANEQESDHVQD